MTELLKKIVDEAPMGIYVLDAERKIVFWSTGAERITGYSQEEMVGRHCFEGMLDHIEFEKYEGVIVIATEIQEKQFKMLEKIPVPFVCVDNMMPGMEYSCVGIDNEENVS